MMKTFTKNEIQASNKENILQLIQEIDSDYKHVKKYLDLFKLEPSKESVEKILNFSKSMN